MSSFIDVLLDKEALSITERREAWVRNRSILGPIVADMRLLNADISYFGDLSISTTGDAHKLTACVRILRSGGFKPAVPDDRPKPGTTSWGAHFNHPQCTIRVWFYFTSSVCKRVKVGTKMVEQPIYETRCEAIALPEDPAPDIVMKPAPEAVIEDMPF